MSDDVPDLEPIDVAVEFPAATAASTGPGGASWPLGWYADPWTAGQYRFWNGEQWTGETHRSGPAATYGVPGASTQGAAGWPAAPWHSAAAGSAGSLFGSGSVGSMPGPHGPRRQRMAAIVVALVVLVLVAGAIGFAIESKTKSKKSGSKVTPAPADTVPGVEAGAALPRLVVRQADVGAPRVVVLLRDGNRTSQPTLDLCNGTFATEKQRVARLQVAEVDTTGHVLLSTEAVAYRDAAATQSAFAELRKVRAACPHTPVVSPVQEPTVTTEFKASPDAKWPHANGVDRLAYSFDTSGAGAKSSSVAVYLRRGRLLIGVYFSNPSGPQAAVAGKTSIEGIVGVIATRLAELPASVVNGSD